jgi:hypothetical protein
LCAAWYSPRQVHSIVYEVWRSGHKEQWLKRAWRAELTRR